MSKKALIVTFPDYQAPAQGLADELALDLATIQLHRFPDGESKVVLPTALPETVILCRSLHDPNHKLVELLLTARTARLQGVKQLILVAPYLCYMRQDKAFHPGEVVSQTIIGQFLAELFDAVITVDAHLHRIQTLYEAIPVEHAINLTATGPMADFLNQRVKNPFLIGPDSESKQWVKSIAQAEGLDFVVADKQRFGDRDVQVSLPDADFKDRHIVLVDDVASTGKTLLAVAQQLQSFHPASVSVLVNHALFVNDAMSQLRAAGIEDITSCDSIPHQSNKIRLAPLIGSCLKQVMNV